MSPAPGAGSAAEAVADLEGLSGVGRVLSLDAHKDAGHRREALVRQDVGVELGLHLVTLADLLHGKPRVAGLVVDEKRVV